MARNELLKSARKLHDNPGTQAWLKEILEKEFPELAESEDERIRQLLVRFVKYDMDDNYSDEFSKEQCIAYLEKQKEQKPVECIPDSVKFDEGFKTGRAIGFKEGVESVKPVEWSEEDENGLCDLMWCISQARKSAKDENDMGNIWSAERWLKDRLKSLRPQPHWKPDVEDYKALNRAIEMADELGESRTCEILKGIRIELKSL